MNTQQMGTAGRNTSRMTGWVGWIAFAAIMMLMTGTFNVISGMAAVFNDEVFVAGPETIVLLDLTTWGWVHIFLGLAVAGTGLALMSGQMWARVVGVLLVMLNMVTQLLLLPAYPWWAVIILAVDTVVLWAIIVHGDEAKAL
jgi:hypothetical protein